MKNKGMLNWNSKPFTRTRSPTVAVPAWMSSAVRIMMEESPREKIAFCPALRSEREVWVLRPDFWYSRRERSYLGEQVKRKGARRSSETTEKQVTHQR